MKNKSLGAFVGAVSEYIDKEYNPDEFLNLTTDEKYTIRTMIEDHYYHDGCVSNVANNIINYLRASRFWSKKKT